MRRLSSSWQNVWTKLGFSKTSRRRSAGRRAGRYSRALRAEPLEDRRLLYADLELIDSSTNASALFGGYIWTDHGEELGDPAFVDIPNEDSGSGWSVYSHTTADAAITPTDGIAFRPLPWPWCGSGYGTLSSVHSWNKASSEWLSIGVESGGDAPASAVFEVIDWDPEEYIFEVRLGLDVFARGTGTGSSYADFGILNSIGGNAQFAKFVLGRDHHGVYEAHVLAMESDSWWTVDAESEGFPVNIDDHYGFPSAYPSYQDELLSFRYKFYPLIAERDEISFWSSANIKEAGVTVSDGSMSQRLDATAAATGFVIPGMDRPIPTPDDETPPKVIDVTISETDPGYSHEPYHFATATFEGESVDGSGNQLRTVPVGGANTITIEFGEDMITPEDVWLVQEDLSIIGLRTGDVPNVASFSLDGDSATWVFDAPFAADQYLIKLSDWVSDGSMNWLDGEWVNPISIDAEYNADYAFPSGDGVAGGDFEFVFNILPADYNRDLSVGTMDNAIWLQGPAIPGQATHGEGDANGDGWVGSSDRAIYFASPTFSAWLGDLAILADLNGDYVVNDTDWDLFEADPVDFDSDGDTDDDPEDIALMEAFLAFGIDLDVFS